MYSFSRLKRYSECPASFLYKYLIDMPESITEPLAFGKTVHAVIQACLGGIDMSIAIDNAMQQEAELSIDRNEVAKLVQHNIVMGINGGNVEQHFTVPLAKDGTFHLQGYIDWWNELPDGSIHLIDWKTNRKRYVPLDNYQLGLYAWYLSRITGAKQINAELVFLRYSNADSRCGYIYTSQDMEEARLWALHLAEKIEEKVAEWNLTGEVENHSLFPSISGVHCQHCGYASLCVYGVKFEPVQINDHADAQEIAAEVLRIEAALDDMKDKLKIWAKANGDIAVGDAAFMFVPSVSWTIGAEKLYELCTELHENGVDVFKFLTLTAANLKKMGINDDKLAFYGKKKITNTFRLVKAKEVC